MLRFACLPILMIAVSQVKLPSASAQPVPVHVNEDKAANGWDVRVSFRNAPKSFGRAAQTWTLDHAKEVADQLLQQNSTVSPDLSVAEIRIEGKDGNGEIKPGQGSRFTDWPIVEQQFRARAQTKSAEVDKKLRELAKAYQDAADATERVLSAPPSSPTDVEKSLKEQSVDKAYENYNKKVDELEQELFKGRPQPLPKLKMPDPKPIYDHITGYPAAKKMQYQTEQMGSELRKQKSDLMQFQEGILNEKKQIIFDDEAGKNQELAPKRTEEQERKIKEFLEKLRPYESKLGSYNQLKAEVNRQLGDGLFVDSNRVLPTADGFAAEPAGAVYKSVPQTQILKTDAAGKPLPDDQQPAGYPKEFLGGVALKEGEGVFVDPNLRVEMIAKDPAKGPAEVRAGVYGKVTEVDPTSGKVSMQVDDKGTLITMYGIQPGDIKVGEYVEPSRPIGKVSRSTTLPNTFSIQATDANKKRVAPGPVIDFGKKLPTTPGQLKKNSPETDVAALPIKEGAVPKDASGKPDDTARVTFDDNAEKGANYKKGMLDARETLAKRAFERAQEEAARKADEAAIQANKVREAERDLKAAQDKIQSVEKDAAGVLAEAERLAMRNKELAKENESLKANKKRLDDMAAAVKASKNDKAIDEFNDMVRDHNRREAKLRTDVQAQQSAEKKLRDTIAKLQRERETSKIDEAKFQMDRDKSIKAAEAAKAEAERAKADVQKEQQALQAIAMERQQLIEEEKQPKKTPAGQKDPNAKQ